MKIERFHQILREHWPWFNTVEAKRFNVINPIMLRSAAIYFFQHNIQHSDIDELREFSIAFDKAEENFEI